AGRIRRAMRLALFDLDNTLLAGDSDYEWGQFLVDRGVVAREAYEAQNRAFYEQYAAGRLDIHEYLGFALRPLAAHTRGELDRWRWIRTSRLPPRRGAEAGPCCPCANGAAPVESPRR